MTLVRDEMALREIHTRVAARYGDPILQEFIPGELDERQGFPRTAAQRERVPG